MTMLDRLHHVLIPRLEGCLALVLIVFGVFAPPLTFVVTEKASLTLLPVMFLLAICGAVSVSKHLWFSATGKMPYQPTGTTADYRHPGFVLMDSLMVATKLSLWMTLGSLLLWAMIFLEAS